MRELSLTFEVMAPMILLLAVGVVLRRVGWLKSETAANLNKLIFRGLLPVLVFNNMREIDTGSVPDPVFLLFLFLAILTVYAVTALLVPHFEKDRRKKGVMIQGIFRTNFAVLGIILMEAMFGQQGILSYSLALPVVIPMNNILAVLALSGCSDRATDKKKVFLDILTNPLIIGCALGALFLLLRIPVPSVIDSALNRLAGITGTLSLLVLGASLRWEGLRDNRLQLTRTLLAKCLVAAVVMTAAVLLGFTGPQLGVVVILFGSPCAVSSFPMADAMGGDGTLAAGQVALTTVFCMLTLFAMIWIGKLLAVL